MKQVSRFPVKAGELGWYQISKFRDHKFTDFRNLLPSYDYVVVGGGFGGINAAFRLAENKPNANIAIFEALQIGMGDSGRNAGILIDVPHTNVGEQKIDIEANKWRFRLNKIVIDRMRKIKNEHKLQLDWAESGKYLAARRKETIKYLDHLAKNIDSIGGEHKTIPKAELARRLGTDYYVQALYTPGAVIINPSEVIRGLASVLPANVHVFEECPVLQVLEGSQPTVRLVNGKSVKAGKVLLLTSVFIDHFGIQKKGRMTPLNSFGAFTRELTAEEQKLFEGITPWALTAAHPAGTTIRFLESKRIFVRNGFTFSTQMCTSPQRIHRARKKLRKAFEARFPALKQVNFEYVYGGIIPLTLDNKSLFEEVAKNVYAGTVGDGAGLTRSSMLGVYLADMVCQVDSAELQYLIATTSPGWCPPEPFKTIGATVRLAYEDFFAGDEV